MMRQLALAVLIVLCLSSANASQSVKPFDTDSLNNILQSRQGHSFLLVFWSIDCPPCLQELAQIQKMRKHFSHSNLVMISTDNIQHSDEIKNLIEAHQLEHMDNWVFSDSMPERLRYLIDPSWYGELPRAYFYNASHQRRAHSGRLNQEMLQSWLASQSQ